MTRSFTCYCGNTGSGTDQIKVSTQSQLWRRKFSCHSCQDSNSKPFDHESGPLTNQLSWLPSYPFPSYSHVNEPLTKALSRRSTKFASSSSFPAKPSMSSAKQRLVIVLPATLTVPLWSSKVSVTPAGIQTHNLSITSLGLYQATILAPIISFPFTFPCQWAPEQGPPLF